METIFLTLYFSILTLLGLYGAYQFWLVTLYLRNRHIPTPVYTDTTVVPVVTIQLPIFNERMVAERLLRAVAALDWPKEKLEVLVLDDSTDDTQAIIDATVAELTIRGTNIRVLRRPDRDGFKAGALQHGLAQTSGSLVAVFDADNLPDSDFLKRLVPYFSDERLGMVQARWSFLNRSSSLLCRAQALFLDAHFYIEQTARSRGALFLNFNGTAGIWRKEAIAQAGGWNSDTLTEDLDLSFRAQLAGWKFLFLDHISVPTELPTTTRAFKQQQYRWARGAVQTALKILPRIWHAAIPLRIKLATTFHLTQKSISVAVVLLSILLIPALFIRIQGNVMKALLVDFPLFVTGVGAMSLLYGLAYRREKAGRSRRDALLLPMMSAMGIGISINNARAVWHALTQNEGTFHRTPKAGATDAARASVPSDYRIRTDPTALVELFFACNSLAAVCCALALGLVWSIPFLFSFTFGYFFFAITSLREARA